MTMQVLHKNRRPWSKSEKKLSMSLYYKSSSTYKFLRRNGIVLPAESTVRRWLKSIDYVPGFIQNYLDQMKLKVTTMTNIDKRCVILFDEMAIMKCIEYNKTLDIIEGFEDLGPLGRSPKLAKHALVIMVRGLYTNWKFPLCYFLTSNGVKGNDLDTLLQHSVKEILNIGLLPTALICDQGSQNRKLFSLLGGTETNPTTEIHGKKLYLIYDIPHIFKSIRNNLLNGDIQIKNKKIVFKDVIKTYELDSLSTKARAMCKISPSHLHPNPFQKMSCKLALQIFSNNVSSAIKTSIITGQLKSKTAKDTADFLLEMNNTFDACNSKNLYDINRNRRPMNSKNTHIFENINKSISTFRDAKKINHKTNTMSVPPCFSGMVWSLTAIKLLYENEKNYDEENKSYFLLTNRVNQDPLENMFSIMRQKNGYTRNPTARIFRSCVASICTFSLMKVSEKCNCETDSDNYLTVDILSDVEINNTIKDPIPDNCCFKASDVDSTDSNLSFTSESEFTDMTDTETVKKVNLEECSVVYFAGYLAKRCIDFFQCKNCEANLTTEKNLNEPNQLLILLKTFEYVEENCSQGLKNPSSLLILICNISLEVFKKLFDEIKSEKGVAKVMLNEIKRRLNKKISNFEELKCKEHYLYLVKLLLTTRIYKECKWVKGEFISKNASNNNAKLKIFENK